MKKLEASIYQASSTHPSTSPSSVLDSNPATNWNSGTYPVGWITLDLGKPCVVTKVRLLPEMEPKVCHVMHRINVGTDADALSTAWNLDGLCTHNVWVEAELPPGTVAQYVQVHTERSESWLAWRLIEAYGSPQVCTFATSVLKLIVCGKASKGSTLPWLLGLLHCFARRGSAGLCMHAPTIWIKWSLRTFKFTGSLQLVSSRDDLLQ